MSEPEAVIPVTVAEGIEAEPPPDADVAPAPVSDPPPLPAEYRPVLEGANPDTTLQDFADWVLDKIGRT